MAKYKINIAPSENGVISVAHEGLDDQWVESGVVVSVSNQPQARWGLEQLFYTKTDGSGRTDIVGNEFTMPAYDIIIFSVFKRFLSTDWTPTIAGGVVVEAGSNTTVGGYQVPQLTAEQIADIDAAMKEGKNVIVVDATGKMQFAVKQSDSVDGVAVVLDYFSTMILTYHADGTIDYVNIEGGETSVGAVRYDIEQTLTDEHKAKAQGNIGIDEALAEKANIDGYYSQLTAGAAENLVGGNDTSREFTEDTAGGTADIADGIVQIDRIKGNTIVWNQQIPIIPNNAQVENLSVENNKIVFEKKEGKDVWYNYNVISSTIKYNLIHGHKMYFSYKVENYNRGSESDTANFRLQLGGANSLQGSYTGPSVDGNGRMRRITQVANNQTKSNTIYMHWLSSTIPSTGTTATFSDIALIDLTLMFGAGNEPATVEEFEKMFPLDYYDYNAGQLLSLNPTGILTDGFNQYNHNDPHINVFAQAYYIGGTYTSLWFSKSKTDTATAYAFGDALTAGSFYTNGGTHYKANASAAAYDSSKTYAVGAYCIESSVVYKCNTAISAAEAFDATKWTSLVDVAGMVTDGILTSVEITPVDHLFTPTEQGYVHVVGGNATNTVVNLHWSGKRDGEYEPYWSSTRNIPIAQINTDGTITESSTGKTRLFPDGLCKAGSVYNEVTPTKAIKRIGKVDLGSLTWYKDSYAFYTNLTQMKPNSKNVLCSKYVNDKTSIVANIIDKTIICATNYHKTNVVSVEIRDDSYSTEAAFKAAMSGVYLYYELATPVEVTFAEPLNLTYRVSDFGTETLLPINTTTPVTTPIRLDVVYGLNVVDFVRNADKNYLTIEDSTGDNGSSFTNLRSALSTAFGIDIVPTYDSTNKRYTFAISDNRKVEVPSSATASGLKGTWAEDETAVYFCTDTDTWVKINKETW